jgi:hypothetical protein
LQIHGNKDGDADEVRRIIRQLGHEPRYWLLLLIANLVKFKILP